MKTFSPKLANPASLILVFYLTTLISAVGGAPAPTGYNPPNVGDDTAISTESIRPVDIVATDSSASAQPDSPQSVPTNIAIGTSSNSLPASTPTSQTPAPLPSFIKEHVLGANVVSNGSSSSYPIRTYATATTPNDPNSGQWWEDALNLPQAWDTTTGSSDTTIAIIDTGFGLEHEDLAGRWKTNDGESGSTASEANSRLNCSDSVQTLDKSCNLIDDNFDGIVDNEVGATTEENPSDLNCTDLAIPLNKNCNNIDDDGNGLIDDWRGWDFVSYDESVQAGQINPAGKGVSHATLVSGVAAANSNNGIGIAGVNWQTKILPLQALSDNGSGSTVGVARAIRYATEQNVDIISMSLGSTYPDNYLRGAILEATAKGIIVVAASGNNGCDCISYPANYVEVVAVGALSNSGARASFSSYGQNLDILAPGTGIYTTSWSASNSTSHYAGGIAGTSLSTPMVSSAISLIKAHKPSASAEELVALLTDTANHFTLSPSSPHSDQIGFGYAEIDKALARSTTSQTFNHSVGFSGVNEGDVRVHECSGIGTTGVYRLSKPGSTFFSSLSHEVGQAQDNNYSSTLLGYMCSAYSHDQIDSLRLINVHAEFTNNTSFKSD